MKWCLVLLLFPLIGCKCLSIYTRSQGWFVFDNCWLMVTYLGSGLPLVFWWHLEWVMWVMSQHLMKVSIFLWYINKCPCGEGSNLLSCFLTFLYKATQHWTVVLLYLMPENVLTLYVLIPLVAEKINHSFNSLTYYFIISLIMQTAMCVCVTIFWHRWIMSTLNTKLGIKKRMCQIFYVFIPESPTLLPVLSAASWCLPSSIVMLNWLILI